ncbi:MAG TPA: ABC transporter permease [Vicinamibacterales bacterium]|nr:ABC transporter permease [Vicinamibacterales bacterium]
MPFDLRDVLNSLRRTRGYSATVALTLALTIGATTAVFSIVDGILLKPLAYRESHRLVAIRELWTQFSSALPGMEVNEQHFEYWRKHATTFVSMAQYVVVPANLTGAGDAAQISSCRTSGSLFDVLQVQAARGRTLAPADEPSDRAEVVVITDAMWRQRLGSDPAVVGRSIAIDGTPRTIVGVLPADFRLPSERVASQTVDAFVPIHMDAERVGWEGEHNNEAIGRLRDGVTPAEARAELDVEQRQVSEIATREAHEPVSLSSNVIPLAETVVGRSRQALLLLLGAVAAVLLIACSNLANLSLTRALGRARESAIRSALGASRLRLIGRALLEQFVLSAAGGSLGLGVAWGALRLFVRTAPIDLPRVSEVAIDARVLAFAAAATIFTTLAVALVPLLRSAHPDLERMLRATARSTTGDRGGLRMRSALLSLQIALSLTLLVVTALLGASFARLMRVDRGFSADHVLLVPVSMPAARYQTESIRQTTYDRLIAAVDRLPGVTSATALSAPPLSGVGQVNTIAPEGSSLPRSQHPPANFRFVGADFFRTLGIAVLRGRAFTEADRADGRLTPAVITEPTARRLWPGQDPLGKHFSRAIPGEAGFEVVGIAADAKLTSLERTPPLMVYLPYWWRTRTSTSLLIRAAGDPSALMPAVRRAIQGIDPDIAIGDARSLEQVVDTALAPRRYQMQLFVAFGLIALFIATLGVYAVTSYGVSQRRREMNIRVALGARRSQVMSLIVQQAGSPIVAGLAAGAGGAVAVGGLVASLLFEVPPRDPGVIAAVVAIVGAVGLAACLIAARQGLTVNPAAALREE